MVEETRLAFIILVGMLFSLSLSIGMVLLARKNRKIQELSEHLLKEEQANKEMEKLEVAISTQENERTEIARQLHDDVGALLSIAQKSILDVQTKAKEGKIDEASIEFTKEYIQDSIDKLRAINKGLIPHYLLKFGLPKALERMGKQKAENLTESIRFHNMFPEDITISDGLMTHYFYIASELITNLLKHSYPKNIEMSLSLQDTNMELKIKHDGIALSQRDYELLSNDSDSLGLGNIRYRLHTIKGSICFKKLKTYGTIQLNTQLTN